MHVKIEARCIRGLRVIEEIPNIGLCKIEGYNGIGKSNAIKLLRLCTGDQPFAHDDPSWRTFRDQIVQARVTVTNLNGVGDIEWQLEPRRWPDRAEPLGDLLGAVRIDGTSARAHDTLPLLKVYHVSAAETPLKALADRINEAYLQISLWASEHGQGRQEIIDALLGEIAKKVADTRPGSLPAAISSAIDSREKAESLRQKAARARREVDIFEKAVEAAERLDHVRGRGPEMDAKLQELEGRMRGLDSKKEQLNGQISTASTQKHQDEQAEREFDLAQKHLERQDRALRMAQDSLERIVARVGVVAERTELTKLRAEVSRNLNRLTELLPRVHSTPLVIDVLEDLALRLEQAELDNLSDAQLVEPNESTSGWTVSELKIILLAQAAALRGQVPSTDAEKLTEEIAAARGRLDLLARADEALNTVGQAQQSLTRAQERLRAAVKNLPGGPAKTLDELIATRDELDKTSRQLQAEHTRLEQARELLGGGLSEEALAATLASFCAELGVEPARVRGRCQVARTELEVILKAEVHAALQAEKVGRQADDHQRSVSAVAQWLNQSKDLSWLRRAIPELASAAEAPVGEQAEALNRLLVQVEHGRNLLAKTLNAVRGIGTALDNLGARVQSPIPASGRTNDFDTATRLWLSEEVRRWFDDELVRRALFNNAEDIKFDAQGMLVSWTSGGEPFERPLSGFSSGQQAFAYTQAQVARLDREESPAENRLIALDEFNAFLDRRLMSGLADYLIARQQDSQRDQVVVILPLDSIPSRSSSADERNLARAQELERRGYIAEEFLP